MSLGDTYTVDRVYTSTTVTDEIPTNWLFTSVKISSPTANGLNVYIVSNHKQWAAAYTILLKEVRDGDGCGFLGVDIEGFSTEPPALMQLCAGGCTVVLIQLNLFECLPDTLIQLLTSTDYIKCGSSIWGDIKELNKHYKLVVRPFLDGANLGIDPLRLFSYESVVNKIIGLSFVATQLQLYQFPYQMLRLFRQDEVNWQHLNLSEDKRKIYYAAMDGYLSFQFAHHFISTFAKEPFPAQTFWQRYRNLIHPYIDVARMREWIGKNPTVKDHVVAVARARLHERKGCFERNDQFLKALSESDLEYLSFLDDGFPSNEVIDQPSTSNFHSVETPFQNAYSENFLSQEYTVTDELIHAMLSPPLPIDLSSGAKVTN